MPIYDFYPKPIDAPGQHEAINPLSPQRILPPNARQPSLKNGRVAAKIRGSSLWNFLGIEPI
jgi:hypothetical protein